MGWTENELLKIVCNIGTFLIQQKRRRERGFLKFIIIAVALAKTRSFFIGTKSDHGMPKVFTQPKICTTASSKSWIWREALTDLMRSHDQCVRYTIVVASRRDYDLPVAFHSGELLMLIEAEWWTGSNILCLLFFFSSQVRRNKMMKRDV